MGKHGIRQVAELCTQKAHYLAEKLQGIGIPLLFSAPFFKEFAVKLPVDPKVLNKALIGKGFLGGLPLSRYYPELDKGWLLAVTEKRTKAEMDAFVQAVRECTNSGLQ